MKNNTVLLVDDEPIILTSLAADLEQSGFIVHTAAGGEQARDLLSTERFDLVVTDLVMPGIGGIEVLRSAKTHNPGAAVMILTGYGDMASAIEALRLGADDYLVKPCDPDEFMLRIERCLEKQEAVQQIKIYEKILPVCVYCKSIRDDTAVQPGSGTWVSMEEYLVNRAGAGISHGCCPDCYAKYRED